MLRDLLVHVDGSLAGRTRVQLAVKLAACAGAKLSGIHVTPPIEVPSRVRPTGIADMTAYFSAMQTVESQAAADTFEGAVLGHLADAGWSEVQGDVAQSICDHARYTDLVILGQYEWQGTPASHPLPIAHTVVVRCGRPVLVVPAETSIKAFDHIALAWDGSREAVRALHDALPLLCRARSVEIIKILSSTTSCNADDERLREHLGRHRLAHRADSLLITSTQDHDTLRHQIEQGAYDFLVMGGYSHPMWMEFIFGGATQSLLLSAKIPVLVSH